LPKDAPAEIYISDDVGVEAVQAFLGLIDPEFAGQAAEDIGFPCPFCGERL
jgi:hypothetical protein